MNTGESHARIDKKNRSITALVVLYLLVILLIAGVSGYCLWLTRTPNILKEPDAVHVLRIAAAEVAAPGATLLLAVIGLWRQRLWGWWVALLTTVLLAAAFVYSVFDDNVVDGEDISFAVGSVVLVIPLLLPAIMRLYWRGRRTGAVVAEGPLPEKLA